MDAQDPMIKSLMKSQNYLIIFSLPPPFIILKIVINLLQNVCLGILQHNCWDYDKILGFEILVYSFQLIVDLAPHRIYFIEK